jgi:hypothetical protein
VIRSTAIAPPAPAPGRVASLALTIVTRGTASVLLLAAVVVLLVGAQSLLGAMQDMDTDITAMGKQLAVANDGLDTLNTTMEALPKTAGHVTTILATVQGTGAEVKTSASRIAATATTTQGLATKIDAIGGSTAKMRVSHESAEAGTNELATTVATLNTKLAPLVKTQHAMLGETVTMRSGLDNMNDSLAFIVRVLNEMSEPHTGGGMTIRADLTKDTMPPIPGLKVEADPIQVFERGAFPLYKGR